MKRQLGYMNLIVATCFASLCLLAGVPAAQAQEFDEHGRWVNGFTEPWFIESTHYNRDEIGIAITRWTLMGDIRANGDEWAGFHYSGSETHGTYLRWSPEAGYVLLSVSKCEARVLNVDYGKVEFSPGLVRFISERAAQKTHAGDHDHSHGQLPQISKLLPVKWRGARYLVAESELAEFCEQAAGLGKYNEGMAALLEKWGHGEFLGKFYKERGEVAEELPIVPAGYERFVKSPVEASVTAVGAKRIKRVTFDGSSFVHQAVRMLSLDAGSLNGVRRGMTLHLIESEHDDTVKITRVGKRTSTGILIRRLDDKLKETYTDWKTEQVRELPEVRIGWRLTTSP